MNLSVQIVSDIRVFPSAPQPSVTQVALSIIVATVLNFAPSETVLLYDPSDSQAPAISPSTLQTALEHTLSFYPQWCGRLHQSPYDPHAKSSVNRYGRLMLTYGNSKDPGVGFVVAVADQPIADIIPSRAERAESWDASSCPSAKLVPKSPTSNSDLDNPGLASFVVQVTTFSCGGMAVALKFAHSLTDAHGVAQFARDWASVSRALATGSALPELSPIFNPSMLNECAAGDLTSADPNPDIVAAAHALPCHRYDWWTSGEDCPFPTKSTVIPKELTTVGHDPAGTRMPWSEWDGSKNVLHYVLHFTGPELKKLWQSVYTSSTPVSRQDALLGHIWSCINRARGLQDDDDMVHLDYSLGLRARTSPKLPDTFVGSPLVIAAISATGREASTPTSAHLPTLIRSTVAQFTPEKVAAHLHAKLYEQSPQRIWQAFLGTRHILVTSWIHTRLYHVDFGGGRPIYVEGVMPKIDGLLQLMEGPPTDESGSDESTENKHWADAGVDVQLHLAEESMQKFLNDPLLRKYR